MRLLVVSDGWEDICGNIENISDEDREDYSYTQLHSGSIIGEIDLTEFEQGIIEKKALEGLYPRFKVFVGKKI